MNATDGKYKSRLLPFSRLKLNKLIRYMLNQFYIKTIFIFGFSIKYVFSLLFWKHSKHVNIISYAD